MKRRCIIAMLALVPACDFSRVSAPDPDAGIPDGPSNTRTPPRLVSPVANAYTGAFPSGAPTRFSWTPGTGPVSGSIVEIASSADFAVNLTRVETTAQHVDVNLAPTFGNAVVPVGRRLYWRVRECSDGDCSSVSAPRILHYGRSAHDFNGDGFGDVAVGEPFGAPGRAYVFFGGAGSLDLTNDGSLSLGGTSLDSFGESIDSGDFNGDGFTDLLVGATTAGTGGRAAVYFGGSGSAFNTTVDWVTDGPAGSQYGSSVASVGDVNGDGFTDALVGAFGTGSAFLYLGGAPFKTTVSEQLKMATAERYGISVAGGADFNNDGLDDFAVGSIASSGTGVVYLYYGHPSGRFSLPSVSFPSPATGQDFARRISFVGDLDGDGYSELAICAPQGNRVYLYMGRASAPTTVTTPSYTLAGENANDAFGSSIAARGDLNRDGLSDLVIGAKYNSANGTNAGRGYVFFGSASFSIASPLKLSGDANYLMGGAASYAGDLNGDGLDDLIFGTEHATQPLGRSYIFRGGAAGQMATAPHATIVGTVNGGGFGSSVAEAVVPPRPDKPFAQCGWRRASTERPGAS